ncbi:hypothetical protein EG68_00106 [Paragonimus skrjabini miyazakii]|uniref:EVA1 domain-containing protein n=1 Tax=Paragonimus skrjabini miyazakii TaxID=59628 RepID=A0A8S9Z9N0_9TREM|nr:hypothetical protein EG68_00106 [Paragonimus skrjabini miyazakii]
MSQMTTSSAPITTRGTDIPNDADSTPLYIALGCAVGVFMLLMLIIILDTLCRNRRNRASNEKQKKATKGAKSTASTSSADEESQEELPSTSSEEYEINESETKRPLSDMLLQRLEEVEEDSRFYGNENPLDYGYEGEDNSQITTANESWPRGSKFKSVL